MALRTWDLNRDLNSEELDLRPYGGPMLRSKKAADKKERTWRVQEAKRRLVGYSIISWGVSSTGKRCRGQITWGPVAHGKEFRFLFECDGKPLNSFKVRECKIWITFLFSISWNCPELFSLSKQTSPPPWITINAFFPIYLCSLLPILSPHSSSRAQIGSHSSAEPRMASHYLQDKNPRLPESYKALTICRSLSSCSQPPLSCSVLHSHMVLGVIPRTHRAAPS